MPDVTGAGFLVLGVTMVVNVAVALAERREGRRLGSDLLVADAAHTASDVLASLLVLGSFTAARFGIHWADLVATALILVLILRAGFEVLKGSLSTLSDERSIEPRRVEALALEEPGVLEAHNVRSRGPHDDIHLDLHILVHPATPLAEAHAIGHRVESRLRNHWQGLSDVVVHVEPALESERAASARAAVSRPRDDFEWFLKWQPGRRSAGAGRDRRAPSGPPSLQVVSEVAPAVGLESASRIAFASAPNCRSKKWLAPSIGINRLGSAQRGSTDSRSASGHTVSAVPWNTSFGIGADSSASKLERRTGGAIRIRRSVSGSVAARRAAIHEPNEKPPIQDRAAGTRDFRNAQRRARVVELARALIVLARALPAPRKLNRSTAAPRSCSVAAARWTTCCASRRRRADAGGTSTRRSGATRSRGPEQALEGPTRSLRW